MKILVVSLALIILASSANAQNIVGDKITLNGSGSAGDISTMSVRTEIAGTYSNLRTLTSRFGETYNVLDWGIDGTGAIDSTAALQNLASLATAATPVTGRSNTIYFPPGNYKITGLVYFGSKTTVETGAGVKFTSASGVPNTIADPSVLINGEAGYSFQMYSTNTGNEWTSYFSQVQGKTSSVTNYQKGALYAGALSYDPSAYTPGTSFDTMTYYKDAVGADLRGTIARGNEVGRAWGAVLSANAGSATFPSDDKTDGLLVGLEVDMRSDVKLAAQGEYNRFNSKTGILIANLASKQITTAMLVNTLTAPFFDGVTIVKQAVSRNAFQVLDLGTYPAVAPFAVDPSGNTSVKSLVLASYTFPNLPTANTAGREVLCSNCRKPGESAGNGTGMLVFDDGHAHWVSTAGTIANQ